MRDKPKERLRGKLGWLQTQQEEPDTIFPYSVGEKRGGSPRKRGRKGTEDGRGTSGRGKFYKGKKQEKSEGEIAQKLLIVRNEKKG